MKILDIVQKLGQDPNITFDARGVWSTFGAICQFASVREGVPTFESYLSRTVRKGTNKLIPETAIV